MLSAVFQKLQCKFKMTKEVAYNCRLIIVCIIIIIIIIVVVIIIIINPEGSQKET
jgi:hypothetical protein